MQASARSAELVLKSVKTEFSTKNWCSQRSFTRTAVLLTAEVVRSYVLLELWAILAMLAKLRQLAAPYDFYALASSRFFSQQERIGSGNSFK